MTDSSDPFASFFEKKDKKAKSKKVKNVVATDELADRLQRAAVREQQAKQSVQAAEGATSTFTTAVEILDEDDEYLGGNAAVANLDDEGSEERKLERDNSSSAATAASKLNPWGLPAKTSAPTTNESSAAPPPTLSSVVPVSARAASDRSTENASVTIPDLKLAVPTESAATQLARTDAGKATEAEKPKAGVFVPKRVKEAMESGQINISPAQRPAPVASGAYRPPGFRGESSDVRSFSNDVRTPMSSTTPSGAYIPPSQRGGGDSSGAPSYYRRTAAPNIQSQNDFPTL